MGIFSNFIISPITFIAELIDLYSNRDWNYENAIGWKAPH